MPQGLTRSIPIVVLAAAARTTSSNSGNLRGTTGNIPVADALALHLLWTTLSGFGGAITLDVWVEDSPDGGTTWIPAYKFTQATTSAGSLRINTRTTGLGITEAGAIATTTSNATTAINGNTVLSPDHRIRWELAGGNSSFSSNFAVFAVAVAPGTKYS